MSDKSTGYKKKYYYKNNYGKYYTYRRIRGIMSKYARVKLSAAFRVEVRQLQQNYVWEIYFRDVIDGPLANAGISLVNFFRTANKYEAYRQIYSHYKIRGILVETNPSNVATSPYVNNNNVVYPWAGDVKLGITQNQVGYQYDGMADNNYCASLNRTAKTRIYMPTLIKDFSAFPTGDNVGVPSVPYYLLVVANMAVANDVAAATCPTFNGTITFYVTLRQGMY